MVTSNVIEGLKDCMQQNRMDCENLAKLRFTGDIFYSLIDCIVLIVSYQ